MSSRMNKVIAIFAGVIALLSVIPIDFLSWWKTDVIQTILGTDYKWSNYINAFGQFSNKIWQGDSLEVVDLGSTLMMAGILAIVGGVIILLAGVKESKGLVVLGAIVTILAPIIFIVGLNGLVQVNDLLIGETGSMFFGSGSVYYHALVNVQYGTGSWYLNVGFFLPFLAGFLGFLSAKSNK